MLFHRLLIVILPSCINESWAVWCILPSLLALISLTMPCGLVDSAPTPPVSICLLLSTFFDILVACRSWLCRWGILLPRYRTQFAAIFRTWAVRMLIGHQTLLIAAVYWAIPSSFRVLLSLGLLFNRNLSLCLQLRLSIMPWRTPSRRHCGFVCSWDLYTFWSHCLSKFCPTTKPRVPYWTPLPFLPILNTSISTITYSRACTGWIFYYHLDPHCGYARGYLYEVSWFHSFCPSSECSRSFCSFPFFFTLIIFLLPAKTHSFFPLGFNALVFQTPFIRIHILVFLFVFVFIFMRSDGGVLT